MFSEELLCYEFCFRTMSSESSQIWDLMMQHFNYLPSIFWYDICLSWMQNYDTCNITSKRDDLNEIYDYGPLSVINMSLWGKTWSQR